MRFLLIMVVLVSVDLVSAQTVVKDINQIPTGSSPKYFSETENGIVFTASSPEFGNELWITDGTESGTRLLRDLNVGPESSDAEYFYEWDGRVIFYEGLTQNLYLTNGSESGTVVVSGLEGFRAPRFTVPTTEGIFVITRDRSSHPLRYIRKGESVSRDIVFGCCVDDQSSIYGEPVIVGDSLYYLVTSRTQDTNLWRTSIDGLVTERVEVDASNWIELLGKSEDRFIYHQRMSDNIHAVYSWSPGSGEIRLQDLSLPNEGLSMRRVGSIQNRTIIFSAPWSGPLRFISTDGTPLGTEVVFTSDVWVFPSTAIQLDDALIFSEAAGTAGTELWRTDGTIAGTFMVKDIFPGSASGDPERMRLVGNQIYFCADDGIHGVELWKTDGTEEGTLLVADMFEADGSSVPAYATQTEHGLLVSATTHTDGREARLVDPQTGSHSLLKAIGDQGTLRSRLRDFVSTPASLIFNADDGINGLELWISDGSENGTELIADTVPGQKGSWTSYLGALDEHHYWSHNGTVISYDSSLQIWSNIVIGSMTIQTGRNAKTHDDEILFSLKMEENGESFWIKNAAQDQLSMLWSSGETNDKAYVMGKARGSWIIQFGNDVYRLSDTGLGEVLFTQTGFSGAFESVEIGENLIFAFPQHVVVTDGTPGGTIDFFNTFLREESLVVLGQKVLFPGRFGAYGRELLISDGTLAGTSVVKDLVPGLGGSDPKDIFVHEDRVYFTAFNASNNKVLWVSDGTEAGTEVLWSDFGGSDLFDLEFDLLTSFEEGFIFTINHSAFGRELWLSDGTHQGTLLLADLVPGENGSDPEQGGHTDEFVFFSATGEGIGHELWNVSMDYISTSNVFAEIPNDFFLMSPIYPNPFGQNGRFTLTPSISEYIEVSVYDILGRKMTTLYSGWLNAGIPYELVISGSRLPNGIYIVKAEGKTHSAIIKTLHIK